jgi:hypothetical protein
VEGRCREENHIFAAVVSTGPAVVARGLRTRDSRLNGDPITYSLLIVGGVNRHLLTNFPLVHTLTNFDDFASRFVSGTALINANEDLTELVDVLIEVPLPHLSPPSIPLCTHASRSEHRFCRVQRNVLAVNQT